MAGDEARISFGDPRSCGAKLATYVTLKEVRKRWGHGQEDVFPVAQFEKLWSDLTALSHIDSGFVVVPRLRGQQLKDPAQLDGWLRDGSAGAHRGVVRVGVTPDPANGGSTAGQVSRRR
jgi:hypothetical protein